MEYDLMIMGGGPGGYVAAERAGEAGKKVLLVEKGHLGGVCLNCGCIPSKTLLNSAKLFYYAGHSEAYGVKTEKVTLDFGAMMKRKETVIETLRKGVAGLMKMNKVTVVQGEAQLISNREIEVNGERYQGANIMIATGSSPAMPPIPGIDSANVCDSTGILSLESLPERVTIIGGGVIGCEFACVFGMLGIPVTVIEMLPEICPAIDVELAKTLRKSLEDYGVRFELGAGVTGIDEQRVTFARDGETLEVEAGHVLVATGRRCNVEGLGLEKVGVDFDRRGIRIDDRCATNVPGVYAVGDVTGRQWLAHAASRMGEVVVHQLCGREDRMRYDVIPGVVYTTPDVATAGMTEQKAKELGIPVKTAKRPMSASGRFLAEHADGNGFCKVVTHAETGAVLGVHMIGGNCSEMIFGAAVMIESEMRIKEIDEIVFPHPTVSELMRETLLMIH